jgi:lysophospholipase L1-like esterase
LTGDEYFKTAATALGSVTLLSGCGSKMEAVESNKAKNSIISKGDTVLFQGDSITDSGRVRSQAPNLASRRFGYGYVYFIAGRLMAEKPEYKLNLINRGISGNTVTDLTDRWDADCIQLKPDVLSILIGVNDIWHTFQGTYNGTVEKYETGYRALLERTVKALPDVKLIICEPYVLRCGSVTDEWFPEFDHYRAAAKKMSKEFKTEFVPFQTMFDNAVKDAESTYWSEDGVHPTIAGAALMANEWLKVVVGEVS